jgi:phage recombination protein Bet
MKTELATTQNQQQVAEKELISYLDALGMTSKLTENEKNVYIGMAKAFNLNPFKREIHVSKYGDQMSLITGYEVYIKRAERTGLLNGWSVKLEGYVDANNPSKGDLTATLIIHRKDQSVPFEWEVYYDECVQTTKEGKVTKFWQKPKFMLKKVAISQGFRLCFSDELGGMPYTSDEMPEQPSTLDVLHEEVKELKPLTVGSKAFTSAVKALRGGKSFEDVEKVAYGQGLSISEDVKNSLLNAVEEVA